MAELKPYPNARQAWMLMFMLIGIDVVVLIPLNILFFGSEFDFKKNQVESPFLYSLNDFLTYTISGILGFIVAYRKRRKSGITARLGFKKVPLNIYILSIAVVLCIGCLDDMILYLLPIPGFILELFSSMNQKSVLMFATVVIAAPVLEELVFRGVMLDGLLKNTTSGKAILVSALIFAVIHGNPWQGATAFMFGILAGWLYVKTNSLVLCIVLHATNNFVSTVVGWLYTGDSQTPIIDLIGLPNYLVSLLVLFMVAIGCMRLLNGHFKKTSLAEINAGDLPM